MACIRLHCPETQACVVTGYSHLRWQDSHNDGQLNFLYNIIKGSYFATRAKGKNSLSFQVLNIP